MGVLASCPGSFPALSCLLQISSSARSCFLDFSECFASGGLGVAVPFPGVMAPMEAPQFMPEPEGSDMPRSSVFAASRDPEGAPSAPLSPQDSMPIDACRDEAITSSMSSGNDQCPEPAEPAAISPPAACDRQCNGQAAACMQPPPLQPPGPAVSEVAAVGPLQPRKKPTRRGGKRARHRPCHAAAAAMEWASSVGSAETPSFGEPASGEEAEGEGETQGREARLEAVPMSMPVSAQVREEPKASKASKPRSFYPLAARLRVSAGLKQGPQGGSAQVHEVKSDANKSETVTMVEPKKAADWSCAWSKDEALNDAIARDAREWPRHTIEVIEEVEPEPASASDVSDIPTQAEPAKRDRQGDFPPGPAIGSTLAYSSNFFDNVSRALRFVAV